MQNFSLEFMELILQNKSRFKDGNWYNSQAYEVIALTSNFVASLIPIPVYKTVFSH